MFASLNRQLKSHWELRYNECCRGIQKRSWNPMAKQEYTANLEKLLLHCVSQPDPMLSMLEWLCEQLMEAEISQKVGAMKNEQENERTTYRSGYRPRRFDTRMGTLYLMAMNFRMKI